MARTTKRQERRAQGQRWRRVWRWLPALLLMAVIFFLSAQPDIPGPADPLLNRLLKKGSHALGYGLLALSYRWPLRGHGVAHPARWAWGLALLYAISDEWHQRWVPNRSGQPLDVLIDMLGATLALAAYGWWAARRQP